MKFWERKPVWIMMILLAAVLVIWGMTAWGGESAAPSVPPEELVTVPDFAHYLGTEELRFDIHPKDALEGYRILLQTQYGLTDTSEEHYVINLSNVFDSYEFVDRETGRLILTIRVKYVRVADYLCPASFITLEPSPYCDFRQAECWLGDITPFLYSPERWRVCTACSGRGSCPKCHGTGETGDSYGDTHDSTDCKYCVDGDCGECLDGEIRVYTDEEFAALPQDVQVELDWKRFADMRFDE